MQPNIFRRLHCVLLTESDNPLLALTETSRWKYSKSITHVKRVVLVYSCANVTRLHKLNNGPKPNVSSL